MRNIITLWGKSCTWCKELKTYEEFHISTGRSDGYSSWCKVCRAAYAKAHPRERTKTIIVGTPDGGKVCRKCLEEKSFAEFTKDAGMKDGFNKWCKPCCKAHNAPKAHIVRKTKMLRKYKLTVTEYDAILEAQGNVCAICKNPEIGIDPRSNAPKRLAVDHCHKTGRIRELLCYKCNCAFGLMDENPLSIVALLAYAEKWQVKEEG